MHKDNIELRSEEFQAILGRMPHWILRSGITVVFLFLATVLILAKYIHYPDKIKSKVEIVTKKASGNIFASSQGSLRLLVDSTTKVIEGNTVAYIENAAKYEDILFFSGLLKELSNCLSTGSKFPNVSIDNKLSLGTLQSDYVSLVNKLEQYSGAILSERPLKSNLSNTRPNSSVGLNIQQVGANPKRSKPIKTEENLKLRRELASLVSLANANLKIWKLKYFILSPVSGKLYFFPKIRNKAFVVPNQALFTVIPLDTSLAVISYFPISSATSVKVGQKILIQLDSYPTEKFGMLNAKIESISFLPINGNYTAKANLENGLFSTAKVRIPYRQEMSGAGEILTKDNSVLDKILYQFYHLLNK